MAVKGGFMCGRGAVVGLPIGVGARFKKDRDGLERSPRHRGEQRRQSALFGCVCVRAAGEQTLDEGGIPARRRIIEQRRAVIGDARWRCAALEK